MTALSKYTFSHIKLKPLNKLDFFYFSFLILTLTFGEEWGAFALTNNFFLYVIGCIVKKDKNAKVQLRIIGHFSLVFELLETWLSGNRCLTCSTVTNAK